MKCIACQRRKCGPRTVLQNKRDPVGIRWEKVSVDIMGPINTPSRQGSNYILVATDYFSKYTEIHALVDHKAVTVANALLTNWFCRHGPPKELLSDQKREFVSELMQHFSKSLGITQIKATAFHPSSNGAVERQNRTIQDMIAVRINEDTSDCHLIYKLFK